MKKSLFIRSLLASFVLLISIMSVPQTINADVEKIDKSTDNSFIKFCKARNYVVKTIKMVITAYSSTPEETDSTPFISASGKTVEDGFVANNMLPFGTRVRIPELYGDKIFIVEDRMHRRKGGYHVDIWFPEQSQAKEFGAKIANIEVLES